jgi:hypothetical protein
VTRNLRRRCWIQELKSRPVVHHSRRAPFAGLEPRGDGLLPTPRFSILTLLLVVPFICVLTWLNTRSTLTITQPYYDPVMKGMAISVCLDQGWPIWHSRTSTIVPAAYAIPSYDRARPPKVVLPTKGDSFIRRTSWGRVAINASVGLLLVIAIGVLTEVGIRRCEILRRNGGSRNLRPFNADPAQADSTCE